MYVNRHLGHRQPNPHNQCLLAVMFFGIGFMAGRHCVACKYK